MPTVREPEPINGKARCRLGPQHRRDTVPGSTEQVQSSGGRLERYFLFIGMSGDSPASIIFDARPPLIDRPSCPRGLDDATGDFFGRPFYSMLTTDGVSPLILTELRTTTEDTGGSICEHARTSPGISLLFNFAGRTSRPVERAISPFQSSETVKTHT